MPPYDDDDMPPGEDEGLPEMGREEENLPDEYTEPFNEEDAPPPWDTGGEGEGEEREALEEDFPPSQWEIRHEDNPKSEDEYPQKEEDYNDPFGTAGEGEGEGQQTPVDERVEAGRENVEEPELSTVTDENPENKSFTPQPKDPVKHVLGGGPRKLNKQLILYIITGVFAAFIIFTTFIAPLLGGGDRQGLRDPGYWICPS
jgi:hypothetical protein